MFFTKSGAIDYVEHLRDGITLDENYKKKKKMNIFEEYKKNMVKKTKNRSSKKRFLMKKFLLGLFFLWQLHTAFLGL